MSLIIQVLWISIIFIQGFLALSTLSLCKKKKPNTTTTAGTVTPKLDGDKPQDPKAKSPAAAGSAPAAADGGGAATKSKTGAPKSTDKPKTKTPEDTDLRSLPKTHPTATPAKTATPAGTASPATAAAPAPEPADEVKPMSTIIQPGNDNKFISKGNGVFVDKDGNPISCLAQPPAKDDAPVG
uniref:Uncharacterized protein n=1 Tax=Panagrolaimus sp. PS1159 TaxID=55785 RepID=A0AC35FEM0_9BILA